MKSKTSLLRQNKNYFLCFKCTSRPSTHKAIIKGFTSILFRNVKERVFKFIKDGEIVNAQVPNKLHIVKFRGITIS